MAVRPSAPAGIDAIWLRELFTPALIQWLRSAAPPGFCFELNEGHFCAAIPGHVTDADALDAFLAAASRVAGRVREKAARRLAAPGRARTEGPADASSACWGGSPSPASTDVASAASRYMGIAWRRPDGLLRAIGAAIRHRPWVIALGLAWRSP